MLFKRTLTTVFVDSAHDYLKERLTQLKQLDLDKDGHNDVEQVAELLSQIAEKVKIAVESTNFQKLGDGIDQIISGGALIGAAVDRQKLAEACDQLGSGLRQLGRLLRLGVKELKREEKRL